jgi:hypothetical protein
MALKKKKLQKKRMTIVRSTIFADHVAKAFQWISTVGSRVIVKVAVSCDNMDNGGIPAIVLRYIN